MPLSGEYVPSPIAWVAKQVDRYERSGGTEYTTLRDTGQPVVIMTHRALKSPTLRKTPVMRVEHDGCYAAVASYGGSPEHPTWFAAVAAHPHVELQDGPVKRDMRAREIHGEERAQWWDRAVAAFPNYAEYQRRTDRTIPVFVLEPLEG
jgi:deazaflavin-dependent oxidoreductase (nitroreductase family)